VTVSHRNLQYRISGTTVTWSLCNIYRET